MRWKASDPWAWKIKFAWFPFVFDGQWIWLEHYASKFQGFYYQVMLIDEYNRMLAADRPKEPKP